MRPATLHPMAGLPGAGKTTRARALAQGLPAVLPFAAEWHLRLFGQDLRHPGHEGRHAAIEALLRETAARILAVGAGVILDFGFWGRAERDAMRARARALGVAARTHFVDAAPAVLAARLAGSALADPAGAFVVAEADLRAWARASEAPTPDEPA